MRYFIFKAFILALLLPCAAGWAQVDVSSGGPTTTYPTLGAAFTAINNGTHTGAIIVQITGSTTEPATATLNASGTGLANYQSVNVFPTATATISGNIVGALIWLNGADSVTLNGALNGTGATRDLSVENISTSVNTAVIWVSSAGAGAGAVNNSIRNLNVWAGSNAVASAFGIYAAGATISTGGSGADNDNLHIVNNHVRRAYFGIFCRGTSAGGQDGLLIQGNEVGSTLASDYVTFRGVDVQNAPGGIIELNYVHNLRFAASTNNAGIEIGGTLSGTIVRRNRVESVYSESAGGWGAYGINLIGGSNHRVENNMISDIRTINYSLTTTTWNAFGIRITTGTGHQIYHNSVNLFGNLTIGASTATSAAMLITTTAASGLDIRNNVFANSMTSTVPGSKFYAVWYPSGINFATVTLNNNAYMVPGASTPTSSYFVGRSGTAIDYATLANLQTLTLQDANSTPPSNGIPVGFISSTDLRIPAGTVSPYEGAAFPIAGITLDNEGDSRSATTPDIGADEFAGITGDFIPPVLSNASLTPPGNQCTPVPHTVTVDATDASGIDSVYVVYTVGGGAQTFLPMSLVSGNTYTATIPAAPGGVGVAYSFRATDASALNNIGTLAGGTYTDAVITTTAGPDVSICDGGTANLVATTPLIAPVRITEITAFRTGTGATSPYPAYIPAGPDDFVEISNLSTSPVVVGGMQLEVVGAGPRTYTIPAGTTLPASGVMVIHLGTGIDLPANLYFNSGGASGSQGSGSLTGYILRSAPGGSVVDAMAVNGYAFLPASGVTTAEWAGAIGSSSGRAGVSLTGPDMNGPANWVVSNSPSPLQTIGALNPGLPTFTSVSYTWSPGGGTGAQLSVSPPIGTTQFVVTATDGTCTDTDTVDVTVLAIPAAPIATNDSVCGQTMASLTATGTTGTLRWFGSNSTAGPVLFEGPTLDTVLYAQDTFWVAGFDGVCYGPLGQSVVDYTTPAPVSITTSALPVCALSDVTLTAASTNPAYAYTWSTDADSLGVGDSIVVNPPDDGDYYVTATDGLCTAYDTLAVDVLALPSVVLDDTVHICLGDTFTTTVVAAGDMPFRFTEFVLFNFGTGVGTIPAYASGGADFVEITNLSTATADIGGASLEIYGGAARTYTFPAGISVPAGQTLLVHVGSGTDSPANLYYNTGGFNDQMFSGSLNGWLLRSTTGIVVDAIASNGFAFPPAAGVAPTDWAGSITSPGGIAGARLTIADVNSGTNWVAATTAAPLNIGVPNGGIANVGGGAATYTWMPGPITGNTLTVSPTLPTWYFLTVDDGTCQYDDSVLVSAGVPLAASVAATPQAICPGDTAQLSVSAAGSNGVYAYGLQGAVPGSSSTFHVAPTADSTFTIEVFGGCADTVALSIAIDLLDTPLLVAISASDTVLCFTGTPTVSLMAMVTGGGSPAGTALVWNADSLLASDTITLSPALGANTYFVDVEDACGQTGNDTLVVTANPQMSVSINGPGNVCTGSAATLVATATGGDGNYSYAWDSGAPNNDTVQVTPTTDPSVYTLVVSDGSGCSASDIESVFLNPLPTAAFSVVVNPGDSSVATTNTSTNATGFAWAFGDGAGTSTQQNPQYTYGANGTYTITLVASNACGTDTATNDVSITGITGVTGLSEAFAGASLAVFPNPAQQGNVFTLSIHNLRANQARLELLNGMGQRVLGQPLELAAGNGHFSIGLETLPVGVYHVRVTAEGGQWATKLVVR